MCNKFPHNIQGGGRVVAAADHDQNVMVFLPVMIVPVMIMVMVRIMLILFIAILCLDFGRYFSVLVS
jgi:hypothetical protein